MSTENYLLTDFGGRLDSLIKSRKLTQTRVAEGSQVSQSTINNWISGKFLPGAAELVRLASFMQMSPNELLGWGAVGEERASALRESPRTIVDEVWKSRAITAEKKLNDLRNTLRRALEQSSPNPMPDETKISSTPPDDAEAVVRQAEAGLKKRHAK